MTLQTYSSCIKLLQKNYDKMTKDQELINMWYTALRHFDDKQFIEATKKIMLNEIFAPNLATLAKYCSESAAPLIEDTEGWGIVVKAINNYGYMRAEEAMKSLPETVRKAVEYMGGFKLVCESEAPDVVRGQFNKCMAAVNARERAARKEKAGLEHALLLANRNEDKLQIETKDWTRKSTEETEQGLQSIYEAYRRAINYDN